MENYEQTKQYRSSVPVVTVLLILANIIMYLISAYKAGNIFDIDTYTLYTLGAKYGPAIAVGQTWRLFTCMFLHANALHILFNMYSLYFVGTQVEEIYGKPSYIIIYLFSGIGASYLSYRLSYSTVSVGASGAIFGLLGAMLIFILFKRNRIRKGALSNLLVVIALNLYIGFTSSGIDNFAHIGGLVTGIILSLLANLISKIKGGFYNEEN